MAELRTAAARLATLSLATPAAEQQQAWREQVAALSQQKELLERKLATASREFRGVRQAVKLAEVRAALPPQGAVIDFLMYFDITAGMPKTVESLRELVRYAAYVVPREGQVTFRDLGSAFAVRDAIDAWRKDQGRSPAAQQAAHTLRSVLWAPLETHLAGVKTVLVCPDGDLGKFPWAALPGKEAGTYLLEEDRLLAVVPAAQAIPELLDDAPRRQVERNLLVLGAVDYEHEGAPLAAPDKKPKKDFRQLAAVRGDDTLEFTLHAGMKAEPGEIAGKYKEIFGDDRFTLLEGGLASEEAVRSESPRHLYLHFATHGFFAPPSVRSAMSRDTVDPSRLGRELATSQSLAGYHPGLLSGIALAGANRRVTEGDDGILTAEEVGTLNLTGVQLVVLSACETGLGQSAGGEGLLGLQRAFQAAGAKTVIASLWKVPDAATRDLMDRFYDNLWHKEMGKLEALREAQQWMLRDRGSRGLDEVPAGGEQIKRLPPYYWAAFVLSGDWR
jgi:CHAT domain-containing protein